jgi:ribosomal protein L37AE/L43A
VEAKKTYIYVKQSPKGLLYLGKTVQDPYRYKGSGLRWENHLKAHGVTANDIKTWILHETTSLEEIERLGLYYSSLFNVVESDIWANMKEETGGGGFPSGERHPWFGRKKTLEHRQKLSITSKGNKSSLGKKHSDETKRKQSEAHKGKTYEKVECPHCHKMVAHIKAKQWHFDNCPTYTGIKNKQPEAIALKGEKHPLYGKKRPEHSEFMRLNNPNKK